jgi:hypothetical protein
MEAIQLVGGGILSGRLTLVASQVSSLMLSEPRRLPWAPFLKKTSLTVDAAPTWSLT